MKIISEIGINHCGIFKLNEELIRQSALGGADYAKFQLYSSLRVFGDKSRIKNEFTFKQVKELKSICDFYRIKFMASVFDEERLEWCEDLGMEEYKIASRTVVKEKELCNRIISTGKPTYISLGFWKKNKLPFQNDNIKYFNCISKYPTTCLDIENMLRYNKKIAGYSDHTYGLGMCLHQISLGANIIEKHFTLDKSLEGSDHIVAMNLNELIQLKELGGQIYNVRKNLE